MIARPTDEQQAIHAAVAAGGGSLHIEAGAGCAKSSTLEWVAPLVKGPAGALAFNKATADELGKRLPGNFLVKTFNALGHGALARGPLRGKALRVNSRKTGELVSAVLKDASEDLPEAAWDQIKDCVSKAQQRLLVPTPTGKLSDGEWDSWQEIGDDVGLDGDDAEQYLTLARQVLVRNNFLTADGEISFDDQIYASLTLPGCTFARFPTLFVDEKQDLSGANIEMIRRCAPERLVAVGDRHQSIYGFRGAHGDAGGALERLSPGEALPLMVTFRCPQAVVARQQRHVPGYRAAPGAPAGQVQVLGDEAPQGAWDWAAVSAIAGAKPLAVLCRNNAPVLTLAFRLLRSGKGIRMLKGDIGKTLTGLLRKLCPSDGASATSAAGAITDWMEREADLARANKKPERIGGIYDKGESLLAVITGCGATTVGDIHAGIKALFARTTGQTVLGSIHSAKGLEWETVLHLDPWRLPSRQAKRALEAGDGRPMGQERNLLYVAETRTRNALLMGSLDNLTL
jgi:DNA helicase-2/ATP-dependent DNA helicase PcrA